jgi:histidine triad (HIT) family protein
MPEKEITDEDLKNMSSEEIAELQKQNCIFCKIANKEIPAKIIHEDDDTICILDINPASEGHILVYPKKHYMIMPHIPDDVLSKIFKNVKLMSQTLLKTLQCRGTTIFVANGAAAGQRAPHVIVHVFPRRENDGLVNLPEYEMSDEQITKLKQNLLPYINQIFGVKRKIVKDAEFIEKKREPKKSENKEDADINEGPDEASHHEKRIDKDEDNDDNNRPKKDTKDLPAKKDSKAKVDLDDIAKLFGG